MAAKLIKEKDKSGVFLFYCQGCKCNHVVYSKDAPEACNPKWEYNGDIEKPTFSPSLLYRTGHHVTGQPKPPNCRHCNDPEWGGSCTICHSFIKDGNIQFLNDCTHELAGKTIPLKDI